MVENAQIAALILPWAKEKHPEKYEQTLKVAMYPDTFRRYMTRLIEIRCQAEPEFRKEVPISVLDETALVVEVKQKGDVYKYKVGGILADQPIDLRFWELALDKETFATIQAAKSTLDMEQVDG